MDQTLSADKTSPRLEGILFLTGFLLAFIKACVAPFSFDEAFNYNAFVTQSLYTIFTAYDANNHIINTLGMKAMLDILGNSEISLRVPTLLGRILFLSGALYLTRVTLKSPVIRLTCLLVLVLQPFLLDFGSCARGYGTGLGFAMLGTWLAVRIYTNNLLLNSLPGKAAWWTEILFSVMWGMAIVSVLIFANLYIPIFFFVLARTWFRHKEGGIWKNLILMINTGLRMGLPATILFLLLYSDFFCCMTIHHFHVGEPTLWASIRSVTRTFVYWDCVDCYPSPTGFIGTIWSLALHPISSILMILTISSSILCWKSDATKVLLTGFFGAIAVTIIEHHFFTLPYPTERTGIYFIPLGILLCFALVDKRYNQINNPRIKLLIPLPFLIMIGLQLSIWNFNQYLSYWNTAGGGPAMRFIKSQIEDNYDVNTLPKESVIIYPSWCLSPAQDYYREHLDMPYIKKLGWPDNLQLPEGGHYYITVSTYSRLPKQTELIGPIHEIPELKTNIYLGTKLEPTTLSSRESPLLKEVHN